MNIPATFTYNGIKYKITNIADSVFSDCSLLTSITIPDSVTSIGYNAFSYCTNSALTIAIPNSVTSIGENAFNYVEEITYNQTKMTATGSPWGAKKVNGVVQ